MKIRENCYMLGLGSTGGKIYKEFVQRHYKGAAANGSEQDHKALGDVPNKYILQGFDGFGGHRERAMDCLAGNEDFIKFVEGIKEDIVFILFAGGGSTGSGCAPIVAEMLLEEKDEEGNPVKTVCPVIALPASGESLAKHKNAYETVQELQEIEGLGATFFLNNDSNENYDYINKNFASMLDEFLSNESYGRQNNFDESERLEMLKDSGAMVLSVTGDGTDSKIKLENANKYHKKKLEYYQMKKVLLSILEPAHIQKGEVLQRKRTYDYEEGYEDILKSGNYVNNSGFYDPDRKEHVEFVVQMIPETVYYLTYTLSNRTFRVPLEESEIKQYPDLEVVDVGRITPVYGDITADMLSVQFVEKILLLIKNRNYTLIFENNTEQETEVKDELAAEPVSVE